jgi:hypothetical protein
MAALVILFVSIAFILGIYRWLRARAREEIIANRLDLVRKYYPEKDIEKVKNKIKDGKF